jgi:hypothetical protein
MTTRRSKVTVMDSATLLLFVVPLALGLFFGAARFMRLIGFVASRGQSSDVRAKYAEGHLSFDERLAERLRELDREQR